MNKELSLILLERINDVPFLDRKSGLVQTFERVLQKDDQTSLTKRIPLTAFSATTECSTLPEVTHMIPDSSYKGMVYFEDYGSSAKLDRGGMAYSSKIRLVCWLNTNLIAGRSNMVLSAICINDLLKRLTANPNANVNVPSFMLTDGGELVFTDEEGNDMPILTEGTTKFNRLNVTLTNIPPQSRDIFSKYDYSELETQYLMPPFEYFALDLLATYIVPFACTDTLTLTNNPKTCL